MSMWFRLLIVFLLMSSGCPVWAQPGRAPLNIREDDGDPTTYPYQLKVTDGTLTDNADGTVSLSISGTGLASTDINTSAKLDAIVTDNTGSGALVFNNAPTMTSLVVETSFTMGTDLVSAKPGATVTVCASTARGEDTCDYLCTGADDDVQIQAAIDAVIAATANYGEVRLTEGVFNLKDTINIVNSASVYSRIGLVGASGNGTQIHAQDDFADDSDTVMFQFYETTGGDDTTAGFVFKNILFTGNDANIAIGFIDTMRTATFELWDLRVKDCIFFSFRNTVFVVDDPWGFQLINSIIEDCDQGGVVLNAGTFSIGALIMGNKIVENGDQANGGNTDTFAIKLNGVQHTRIIGNELDTEAVGGYAIELIDSDQNIISGNTFAQNTAGQGGISLDATSDRNAILGNQFRSLAGKGIYVASGAASNALIGNLMASITGEDIDDDGTLTYMLGNFGDEAASKTDKLSNIVHWNLDNAADREFVLDGQNVNGLLSVLPADDTVRMGDSSGANFAKFDIDGDLTFQGTADYIIANDDHIFRAAAGENAGLYLAVGSGAVTGGNEWEWREASAGTSVFSIDLDDGLLYTGVGLDGIGVVDLDYGSVDITDHTFLSDGGTVILDGVVTSAGIVSTGLIDFGGGALEIPQDGTVDAVGETMLDTTVGQLHIYSGTAVRVFYPQLPRCMSIEDLVAADDNKSMGSFGQPVTIERVWCHYVGTGTTTAQISLEDGAGNAMTHGTPLCSAHGTPPGEQLVTAANSLTAKELLIFDVDNTPDPVTDDYTICVDYTYDVQ